MEAKYAEELGNGERRRVKLWVKVVALGDDLGSGEARHVGRVL